MSKKRLFQILDEINQIDSENGTRLCAISTTLISADKVKQGAKICMGTDEQSMFDLLNDKVIPIIVFVDKEEYFKRENQ